MQKEIQTTIMIHYLMKKEMERASLLDNQLHSLRKLGPNPMAPSTLALNQTLRPHSRCQGPALHPRLSSNPRRTPVLPRIIPLYLIQFRTESFRPTFL